MDLKIMAIKDAVNRGDFILYLDTDIVLLKDPLKTVFKLTPTDIIIQNDKGNGDLNDNSIQSNLCAGCIFFYPTRNSINFINKWKNINLQYKNDQRSFNAIKNLNIAKISLLRRKDLNRILSVNLLTLIKRGNAL